MTKRCRLGGRPRQVHFVTHAFAFLSLLSALPLYNSLISCILCCVTWRFLFTFVMNLMNTSPCMWWSRFWMPINFSFSPSLPPLNGAPLWKVFSGQSLRVQFWFKRVLYSPTLHSKNRRRTRHRHHATSTLQCGIDSQIELRLCRLLDTCINNRSIATANVWRGTK